MIRRVIISLCVIACALLGCNAYAQTSYDEYKAMIAEAEAVISQYESTKAELQMFMDAANSGNREEWEKARSKQSVQDAFKYGKDKTEKDAVQSQIDSCNRMIKMNQAKITINQHKMDLYYNAFILQDTEEINNILSNGNRTIPEDISGNIYLAWPYTEIPEGMLTDERILQENINNIYLAPTTVIESMDERTYLVDIYGTKAKVSFRDIDVTIGETVNLYFMPSKMVDETMSSLLVAPDENIIDAFKTSRALKDE